MTPSPDTPVKEETLEEIAERIARHYLDSERVSVQQFCDIADAIVNALHNERERAIRLIDEHQSLDVCLGNCWGMIRAAIREGR